MNPREIIDLSVIFPQHRAPKLHLSLIVWVLHTPSELVMRSVNRDLLAIPFVTAQLPTSHFATKIIRNPPPNPPRKHNRRLLIYLLTDIDLSGYYMKN
jgi:hypothetical protein